MTPNAQEQAILNKFGITDFKNINAIIILEQSAHLDWDWTSTFEGYYQGGSGHPAVHDTYSNAITAMQQYHTQSAQYYYSFCEMSYLRHYLNDPNYKSQLAALKALLDVISISGGGITSAENLVCHGEAFIRNYLVGQKWLLDTFGFTQVNQLWIPDDFGHDAQLPIVLQAMGYQGVGFERVPISAAPWMNNAQTVSNCPSEYLTNNQQLDFIWNASDGSQIQAHWLSNGYCEGDPSTISDYQGTDLPWNATVQGALTQFVSENLAVTNVQNIPYMFVPVDCDFVAPYMNLPATVSNWNVCNGFGTNPTLTCPGTNPEPQIYMLMASFDVFMQLVQAHTPVPPAPSTLPVITFASNPNATVMSPNPYYSGCYTSHPDLKLRHYEATRALLAAEAFEMIVEYLAVQDAATWKSMAEGFRRELQIGWNTLMPSTHHDYVVGTAPNNVYDAEQRPDLKKALAEAREIEAEILTAVALAIEPSPNSGEQSVAVFNPVGVAQSGLVEMTPPGSGASWSSVRIGTETYPVQISSDNNLLFLASAPSYGFTTVYLSPSQPTEPAPLLTEQYDSGTGCYTLTNQYVSAVIGAEGLVSLTDVVLNAQVLSGPGNQIVFYNDGGTIYRFGNEIAGDSSNGVDYVTFTPANQTSLQNPVVQLIEDGVLRKTVQVTGTYTVEPGTSNAQTVKFQMTYALVAGENYLTITATGAAPSADSSGNGYSVMVVFPFSSKCASLTHGTAYHWETGEPRLYWNNPEANPAEVVPLTFEATHDFVLAQDAGQTVMAALYHGSTPAWGIDVNGSLAGCILRNTPGNYNGASGTDTAAHTASYAIRVPGGTLQLPAAGGGPGGPLGEALQFNNPLVGVSLPPSHAGAVNLPVQMSIASTPNPVALVTAVKAGTFREKEMIVRVYQPTLNSLTVTVNIDSLIASLFQLNQQDLQVKTVTALELPMSNASTVNQSQTAFSFPANFALSTLALSRSSTS
jgi:alpha-mannosidase